MKKLFLLLLVLSLMLCCVSCTDTEAQGGDGCECDDCTIDYDGAQRILYSIAEEYYNGINGVYTVDDAASILYCYADKNSGEDISEEDLQKAIWEMIEYYENTNQYFREMRSGELLDEYYWDY